MRLKSTVRYELKYLITSQQRDGLLADLSEYMQPDKYGDAAGDYSITSLYYDTADFKAYWDKVEGYRMRRKVRVRVYGEESVTNDTRCFLEIKQRNSKTVQKRRTALPWRYAENFSQLEQKEREIVAAGADEAILQEIYYLYRALQLRPSCIVRYNRLAYNGDERYPDLRVTFDTNLKGRNHDLTLRSTGYAEDVFLLPPQWCVLELKANRTIPFWLAQLVSRHRCMPQRISKYCTAVECCYRNVPRRVYSGPVAEH